MTLTNSVATPGEPPCVAVMTDSRNRRTGHARVGGKDSPLAWVDLSISCFLLVPIPSSSMNKADIKVFYLKEYSYSGNYVNDDDSDDDDKVDDNDNDGGDDGDNDNDGNDDDDQGGL